MQISKADLFNNEIIKHLHLHAWKSLSIRQARSKIIVTETLNANYAQRQNWPIEFLCVATTVESRLVCICYEWFITVVEEAEFDGVLDEHCTADGDNELLAAAVVVALQSDADNLLRAIRASGKFGGVTGVFAGVHICMCIHKHIH